MLYGGVSGFGVDIGSEIGAVAVGSRGVVAGAEDGEVCDHLLHGCAGVSCDGVELGPVAGREDGCGVVWVEATGELADVRREVVIGYGDAFEDVERRVFMA